jgi:hypothetical protein
METDSCAFAGVAAAAADDAFLGKAAVEDGHLQLPGGSFSFGLGDESLVPAILDTGPAEGAGTEREIDTGESTRSSDQDSLGTGTDAAIATLAKLDEAGFRLRPGRANQLTTPAKIAAKKLGSVDGFFHYPPLTDAQSFTCVRGRL